MPPNLLLLTKLLVVCFFVSGQWTRLPEPFVPFLGVLDDLGSPAAFAVALKVVFAVASVLLLTNRSPRAASLMLGLVLVVGLLASRDYVENNRFFVCLLFLLAGLSDRRVGPRLVQLQIVLVYFGAALNKLLDVDWRSGQYFDHLASRSHFADIYSQISGLLPSPMFSALLGWGVIITEFALAGAFLLRRFVPIAIWVGIAYHTSLVLITGRTFGMFWYAATASYLAFVASPPPPLRVECGWRESACARLRRALEVVDVEHMLTWRPAAGSGLRVRSGTTTYYGVAALLRLGVALPATLFAAYTVAALPVLNHRVVATLVLALLAIFALGVLRVAVPAVVARRKEVATAEPPLSVG
ncbi:MAG: hypothetical protein ACJ77Z_05895 [Thermoleophilaceae bacterium]